MNALDTSLGQQEGFCNGAAMSLQHFPCQQVLCCSQGLLRDLDFPHRILNLQLQGPPEAAPLVGVVVQRPRLNPDPAIHNHVTLGKFLISLNVKFSIKLI